MADQPSAFRSACAMALDDTTIALIVQIVDRYETQQGRLPTPAEVRAALVQGG